MTVRARRVANEWKFLQELQRYNPALIQNSRHWSRMGADWLEFTLRETVAFRLADTAARVAEHGVKLHFPEYFPAVPLEAYLAQAVMHPNIDKESGFVCLWDRFSPGDSAIEAVRQLQRVLSWELYNCDAEHLMQPQALRVLPSGIPLPYRAVQVPPELDSARRYAGPPPIGRKRLS